MDRHISRQLTQVISRFRRLHRWHALSVLWCILALVAAGAWYASLPPAIAGQIAIAILAVGCIGALWLWRPLSILEAEQLKVARVVENTFPDLEQRLLTVVEQTPDVQSGGFSYLQQQLATEVRCHSYGNDWNRSVPFQRIMSRMVFAFVAIGITVFLTGRIHSTRTETIVAIQPADAAAVSSAESGRRYSVSVDPGTTEVERGTSLTIVAKFDGPLPSSISMVQTGSGIQATAIPMQQSLNEPLFGVRLPSVDAKFEYRVEFDDESSETFQVSVFELPRVEQVDARVEFPSYAGIPAELIEDTWQIAAVEGSTAVLICQLNKSIESGFLVSADDQRFELKRTNGSYKRRSEQSQSVQLIEATSPQDRHSDVQNAESINNEFAEYRSKPGKSRFLDTYSDNWLLDELQHLYVARIPVSKPMRLRFELTDDKGRKNREDDEFLIDALPNRPAEIKLTFPAKDLRVSPIEELQLEAESHMKHPHAEQHDTLEADYDDKCDLCHVQDDVCVLPPTLLQTARCAARCQTYSLPRCGTLRRSSVKVRHRLEVSSNSNNSSRVARVLSRPRSWPSCRSRSSMQRGTSSAVRPAKPFPRPSVRTHNS